MITSAPMFSKLGKARNEKWQGKIFLVNQLISSVVLVMVEENYEKKRRESLHERSERHAIYVIIDAVFGLSLGLGAFSLTQLPIVNTRGLLAAIGFFGFSYFIIFMSWMIIRRYFVGHTVYGSINGILFFTGFFIAIMPIPIRIILMQFLEPTSSDLLGGAFMLYPICLSAVTITVGIFSFAFYKQSGKTAPWKDLVHLVSEGVGAFLLGLVFLFSAFMPYELSIEDVLGTILQLPPEIANLPFKVGFWFLGGLVIAMPAVIVVTIILQARKRPL
jgi:hypothetical protein